MTSSSSTILSAFNDHLMELVNDMIIVFPNDPELLTAKNSFTLIRKANPKMVIKIWQSYIVNKYQGQIENGDIRFFIDKDYSDDLLKTENSDKIMETIDRLRNPIKLMSKEEQEKIMKYIQNLTKLSLAYSS